MLHGTGYPGTHQDGGISVFLKMKKGIQKNCEHKHETFLCLVTGHKKLTLDWV